MDDNKPCLKAMEVNRTILLILDINENLSKLIN